MGIKLGDSHAILARMLSGIGAIHYIDDIMVGPKDQEEHNDMLRKFLYVLTQYGLHANEFKLN